MSINNSKTNLNLAVVYVHIQFAKVDIIQQTIK